MVLKTTKGDVILSNDNIVGIKYYSNYIIGDIPEEIKEIIEPAKAEEVKQEVKTTSKRNKKETKGE